MTAAGREAGVAAASERLAAAVLETPAAAADAARLARDVHALRQGLESSRSRLADLERSLAAERSIRDRVDRQLGGKVSAQRFDRQVVRFGRGVVRLGRTAARGLASPTVPGVVIVCPRYPDDTPGYGGQFVRARLVHYAERGVPVQVVVTDRRPGGRTRTVQDGITVHRVHRSELTEVVAGLDPRLIGVHQVGPALWEGLAPFAGTVPLVVWVHGSEAQNWRDREFSYTPEQIAQRREELDADDDARRAVLGTLFAHRDVHVVFVSHHMRESAERFVGRAARAGLVIPNVVDGALFAHRPRRADDRRNLLWIKPFASPKYANDQARDAVLALAEHEEFAGMQVTVVGDGPLFEGSTTPLRGLQNVHLRRGFVRHGDMAGLFDRHGVLLAPTRWDSQGLTCLEAMSCGLVPVTTDIAGVSEFVPPEAGILCPPEDPAALAGAVLALQRDPEDYLRRSAISAETVRRTCDVPQTVAAECDLIHEIVPARRRLGGRG